MSHVEQRLAEIAAEKRPAVVPTKPRDFYEGMCEEYVIMQGRYQGEINRLRAEVARLRALIDAMPSTLTELQDRVTMLETMLSEGKREGTKP